MKNFILFVLILTLSSMFTHIFGQATPPAVGDNASPRDTDVKMRSVELERVKREEKMAEAAKFAPINKEMVTKFPQIKEDFEGIQIAQSAIITAYTKTKDIDYGLIETSANEINKKAKRLDSNLFSPSTEKNLSGKKEGKDEKPIIIKELIVELDNTIASFVSSKIFGNLQVIEPEVAIQTRSDLLKIQELSEKLAKEAAKVK
jgi:hypothetical protein